MNSCSRANLLLLAGLLGPFNFSLSLRGARSSELAPMPLFWHLCPAHLSRSLEEDEGGPGEINDHCT